SFLHTTFLHDLRISHSFTKEIGRIDFYAQGSAADARRTCIAEIKARSDRGFTVELTALDAAGRVVEQMRDYQIQNLERLALPTVHELLSDEPSLRALVTEQLAGFGARMPELRLARDAGLRRRPRGERHARQVPLVLAAAGPRRGDLPELTWSDEG